MPGRPSAGRQLARVSGFRRARLAPWFARARAAIATDRWVQTRVPLWEHLILTPLTTCSLRGCSKSIRLSKRGMSGCSIPDLVSALREARRLAAEAEAAVAAVAA